ncbi:MAG: HNH endonuclease [Nitrospira sp.]|nr:HNH endonuclease [Nitrospira sp.]
MKGQAIPYTAQELAWIKRHCTVPRREAHARFCRRFDRPDVTLAHFTALCNRRGWATGRTGCFLQGNVPYNKGLKRPFNANSARTQFKPGHLPHNTKYLGHERLTDDGYVEISVAETNPYTGYDCRYVLKHKYLWAQQHGPVPPGHVLKCLDGNRLNTDPSNWILISRSLLPFLNGHRGPNYDQAAPELKPAILTLAKLKLASGKRKAKKGQAA